MRRDGYSAVFIGTELGISRTTAATTIRAAGIIDSSAAPDPRHPLRCAKCKQFGHKATACQEGDALDQLDKAEGYKEDGKKLLTCDQYAKLKQAHYQYDIPASTLRINYPNLTVEQIEGALKSQNYDAWR